MENPQTIGMNRTGIGMSPIDTATMLQEAQTVAPPPGGLETLEQFRAAYIKSASAIGTVPPPGTLKGAATTVVGKIKRDKPEIFADLLGERIAFERTGVRLYDLILHKCQESGESDMIPLDSLRNMRNEELKHFEMLVRVALDMGMDATAMTPAADVTGVMSQGLVQVLADPRTSVPQCFEAVLLAELADNDAWATLIKLAEGQGKDDIANMFRTAKSEEDRHLEQIRALLDSFILGSEMKRAV